jgi:hypothetical protein
VCVTCLPQFVLRVPNEYMGRVIGKGGSSIAEIRMVRVWVDCPAAPRTCVRVYGWFGSHFVAGASLVTVRLSSLAAKSK